MGVFARLVKIIQALGSKGLWQGLWLRIGTYIRFGTCTSACIDHHGGLSINQGIPYALWNTQDLPDSLSCDLDLLVSTISGTILS